MPELWLTYGARDIVLDIKVENLNELENSRFNDLQDEYLVQQTESISLEGVRIFRQKVRSRLQE